MSLRFKMKSQVRIPHFFGFLCILAMSCRPFHASAQDYIFLDWDQTLFHNSCLVKEGNYAVIESVDPIMFKINPFTQPSCALLEVEVLRTLNVVNVLTDGLFAIISNSTSTWVADSARSVFKNETLIKLVSERYVSAADIWSKSEPDISWRYNAKAYWKYLEFAKFFDYAAREADRPLRTILSVGDDYPEILAWKDLREKCSAENSSSPRPFIIKTYQFANCPTVECLISELEHFRGRLPGIMRSLKATDYYSKIPGQNFNLLTWGFAGVEAQYEDNKNKAADENIQVVPIEDKEENRKEHSGDGQEDKDKNTSRDDGLTIPMDHAVK